MTDPYQQNNINSQYPVRSRTVDSDDSANYDDDLVIFNAEVTFTLAGANQRKGQNIYLKASSLVGGNVTIIPQAGDSIDGLASLIISGAPGAQQSVILKSDGVSNWRIVGCCDGQAVDPGGCSNTIRVESADPLATLPAPVGGVITLEPNTYYVICGLVNIGDNRIEGFPTTVIAGKDPLVDTITGNIPAPGANLGLITFRNGGTIKDLAVLWPSASTPEQTPAIGFGVVGSTSQNCVAWNLSIAGAAVGIYLSGTINNMNASRILAVDCLTTIYSYYIQPNGSSNYTAHCFLSEIVSVRNNLPEAATMRQIHMEADGGEFAALSCFMRGGANDTGIEFDQVWSTQQFTQCAYFGLGTPSIIADVNSANETTGTAIQSEAVGCVGYTNSTTRGSVALFQNGPFVSTVITIAGSYVPVGNGSPTHPPYTLNPSSVRTRLNLPAPASDQAIRYVGKEPYVGEVNVSLSVALGSGGITGARILGIQVVKNGAALAGSQWEGAIQPNAIFVTGCNVSYSIGDTMSDGDEYKIEIANLTDAADLVVTGAQVTIS